MNSNELPTGWMGTNLGEISEIILGQSPPSSTYNEIGNGLPFYQGKLEFGNIHPTPQKWCTAPKKIAEKGDVLISVRAPVGPTNICPEKSCIGRGLAAIRPSGGIETHFILYFLRAFENSIAGKGTGTTFNAITGDQLREFEVPLPPLPEQRRIVAKLEELFTKLDAGVSALKKTQAQLKRYRQSVLKAACEGKLVPTEAELVKAEGRAYEPADVLLARILKERREKSKGAKYKEPVAPDTRGLPALPDGWGWTTIEQITENFDGKRIPVKESDRDKMDGKYPYYGASGIIDHVNDYLFDGDFLLVAEDGANLLSRSTQIAFQAHDKFWVNNHAHILRTLAMMPLGYLETYLNSIDLKFIITGSAQPKLTQANMNRIPIPLPPLAEQRRIVAEVERRLSVADEVARTVEQSLAQAQRLRQSILKKAFEGRLVAQNPEDEPAGVLLERIRQQKQINEQNNKSKRRKTHG